MTNLLLYQRIAQQLAEDIRRGVYQPGERVPSVRKMSSQLNVSHATVLQAYANLEDQGLIRARPQSGFYVHQTPALTASTPDIARVERPGLVTRASIINQVLTESRREGVFPWAPPCPMWTTSRSARCTSNWPRSPASTARAPSATCSVPASSRCAARWRSACATPAWWSTPPTW